MRPFEWTATLFTGVVIGVLFHEQIILGVGYLQGYLKAKGIG